MRERLKRIDARMACAWILLAMLAVQLVMHLNADNLLADDWYYFGVLNSGQNPIDFLAERWNTWSSRLLIEGAMVFTTHSIWAWRVLDSLMTALMAWALCRLADGKTRPGLLALSCLLVTAIPFAILRSTGWQATSMNYYWPLSCGFMALIPLGDGLRGQRTHRALSVSAAVCAVYAANQEQFAAALAGAHIVLIAVLLMRKRKIGPAVWAVAAIACAQLVMHLTCPGNGARLGDSIAMVNLRDFGQFTLIDKLSIGLTSTTALLFFWKNPMLAACGACVAAAMVSRRRGPGALGAVGVIAAAYVFLALIAPLLDVPFAHYYGYTLQLGAHMYAGLSARAVGVMAATVLLGAAMLTLRGWKSGACAAAMIAVVILGMMNVPSPVMVMFMLVLLLGMMALSLYLCIGHRTTAAAAVLAYGIGFAARLALSFSPTVVESGERTMLPLYGAMMLCALLCAKDCRQEGGRSWPLMAMMAAAAVIAGANFMGSFALAA